jgi:hypothetical protein
LLKIIEKINFSKVYIKVDGYKNIIDKKKVNLVLKEVINFKKKFKSKVMIKKEKRNQGLQINIFTAINWLFKKENRFIFLEDDHKPSISFFYFCDKLLSIYEKNEKIMQIKGSCFLNEKSDDYYFSKYSDVIGWATWKNSWKKMVQNFNYNKLIKKKVIDKFFEDKEKSEWFKQYLYRETITPASKGLWSTWFQLSVAKNDGLCISPLKNLVVHEGIKKNSNPTHYDKSYEILDEYQLDEIDIAKITKKKSRWDDDLDSKNFLVVKYTDPIFKIINRIKWYFKYHIQIKNDKKLSASIKI